jgi:hypothetical protein
MLQKQQLLLLLMLLLLLLLLLMLLLLLLLQLLLLKLVLNLLLQWLHFNHRPVDSVRVRPPRRSAVGHALASTRTSTRTHALVH